MNMDERRKRFPTPAEEMDYINHRLSWHLTEILSLVLGLIATVLFPCLSLNEVQAKGEDVVQRIKFLVLVSYMVATACSILAGWMLKKWFYPDDRERYNRTVHKWAVLIINGGMGVACTIYLLMSPFQQAIAPLSVLGGSVVIYILTWALKIIKPHSFWARFRSVIMRMIILAVITGVIWQYMHLITPIIVVPVLIFTWRNLRRDQKVAGWPNR